ncbi:hypothetical protein F441_08063 [Phytophthora nicotianae CJ01A1]|uniref:Uncharacterized protein n=6 Tax=Phytophthora nicotianae TaxID=4792 RepID=W2QAV9_PHYN3|nr:hypothetical protein PPTG_11302 [Phytophthora nicotianae INRA-310]ETI47817.1 hypothetical protein F443_08091 [Phytophthora nicotianae P1569]ETK87678.1 hypothetical protein L915_07919 [Phytophthora nicotianae]ETO76468.1 hypothetical protein F444_08137 [Phytophthora nicotianae P1976]ETP17550.1 hypothetical protein F441_08063 [Phytophthora nicotianae CJ01A1]ETP45581.1 hypothetical protein F442_08027 [Phytophthora nicotianae P10297]KUF77826.1 hypothetical protein AM587_10012187 [Phytophthora n
MSKAHFMKEYLLALVLWLEHPPNFEKCFGMAKKTVVGQKQFSKSDGFRDLVAALKKSSKGRFDLKPQQMKDRIQTYRARYLKAKAYEASTGAGITAEDEAAGVNTMVQKLENMCPWYAK